jgi:hypothetical protein
MKTFADYCGCGDCRREALPTGWLRVALRLNPRFIFVVVGVIAACALPRSLSARPTTTTLLDRIAFIESSNRPAVIGDGGLARGLYQMHLAAVLDCGGTRADWLNLTNKATADKFAGLYLAKMRAQLVKRGVAQPTDAQLYMAWNLGVGGAAKRGFNPANAPKITRNAIAKL